MMARCKTRAMEINLNMVFMARITMFKEKNIPFNVIPW
jgi:hypothetical protein